MNPLIAFCGLDCATCEARAATIHNDDALRARVAHDWSALNHVEIRPEDINCVGCRVDGIKTSYCDRLCPIHQCALQRGVPTAVPARICPVATHSVNSPTMPLRLSITLQSEHDMR